MSFSARSRLSRLRASRTLLFDFDGTVTLGGVPIGGSVQALNRYLAVKDRRGILVTNNTSKAGSAYREAMQRIGIDTKHVDVVTPFDVAAPYFRGRGIDRAFIVGNAACREEFGRLGLAHVERGAQVVVVAFDTELRYDKLVTASTLISSGVPFYHTHPDLFCPTQNGPVPDCGAITALLRLASGQRSRGHFGKPGARMARFLVRDRAVDPATAILIGDRQSTDIRLGRRLGVYCVWVRTGDRSVAAKPDETLELFEDFFSDE